MKELFEEWKAMIGGLSAVLAGLFVLIAHFYAGSDALSFAGAESAFTAWKEKPSDEKLYAGMLSALAGVPALETKYEAKIAQQLIDMERFDEALEKAERSLKRVKGEAPFHSAYAEATLLIEKGELQKALESAVALKERVVVGKRSGALLYAHNLFRIAEIQRALKNAPGEKAGWEELQTFLGKHKELADGLLTQYITERKKAL